MLSFIQMLIAGLYVMTAVVGLKVVTFGPFHVAAGVFLIAAVKPLVDIVAELYGKEVAQKTILYMTWVRVTVYAFVMGIAAMPAFKQPEGFGMILVGSAALFFAGALAEYIASVFIDLPIFMALKNRTKLGFFMRQIVSNVSIVVQTIVFVSLYVVINPGPPFLPMLIGQTATLIFVSSILAPFATYVVRKSRK